MVSGTCLRFNRLRFNCLRFTCLRFAVTESQILRHMMAVSHKNNMGRPVRIDLHTAHAHIVEQKVLHFLPRNPGSKVQKGLDRRSVGGDYDGLSLMALKAQNAQVNETLERMSDWLMSVDGFPYGGETLKVQGKLEEMKDTELRRYFSEDLQEIFGISPNDPAVRYLVLDTTEGRDGILLILAAAAVALLLIVVIIKKAKKKAPAPVAAAPAGADAPRPYDPEIR